MKFHPLARPLLELLEPYESLDAISIAWKLDAFEDTRWYSFLYERAPVSIHWWQTGAGMAVTSFVAVYRNHIEVICEGGRLKYNSVAHAFEIARDSHA